MCVTNLVVRAIVRVRYATVSKTDYPLLVQVERSVRWLLEQYRSERAQALLTKARLAAAKLLAPPGKSPQSVAVGKPARGLDQGISSHDVLAKRSADVAMRDLDLVDSLLTKLEDMEANEGNPDALARLYQLDHLAARLRRNAENLRVLTGHDAGNRAGMATPVVDVIRAAMSSIEQYPRIEIQRIAALAVVDHAADDLSRLLAELLDNAAAHSPSTSTVTVNAQLTEQGSVLIRIDDAGAGLPTDRLQELNTRLSTENENADRGPVEHLGLIVVRRLAAKHGIRVSLDTKPTHGTTAAVVVPAGLLCEVPATPWFADTPTMKVPRPATARVRVPANAPSAGGSGQAEQAATIPAPRTTRNGLPRRIPQSLREFGAFPSTVPSPRDNPEASEGDALEGREQLMADLDDFSDGEQAAREVSGEGPPAGERRKTT
jgi:signal transduction histidine kinase